MLDGLFFDILHHFYLCRDRFQIKAKENFLGGNAINTNYDDAVLVADRYKQQDYPNYIGTFSKPVTSEVVTPRVNVVELGMDQMSTEWTVYLDTMVDPREQLEKIFKGIKVHERVTEEDEQHRIAKSTPTNPVRSCLPTDEGSSVFLLSDVLSITDEEMGVLLEGVSIEKSYNGYGHRNVGSFNVEFTKETPDGVDILSGGHPATPVGDEIEKYTLKVTYKPKSPDSNTEWHTTPDKGNNTYSPGREAEDMTSENKHVINVYAVPFKVLKTDEKGTKINGIEFSLYRSAKSDESGVELTKYDDTLTGMYYSLGTKISGENGTGLIEFARPETGKTDSQNLLVPGETYYLIETGPIPGYIWDKTVKKITVEVTGNTYTNTSGENINSPAYPYNWNQGVTLKIDGTTAAIVTANGGTASLTDGQGNPRTYLYKEDTAVFRTTIENAKATDIMIKKMANDKKTYLSGAVFSLKVIKNNAEVLVKSDPDYNGIGGLQETLIVNLNGKEETYQSAFVTKPKVNSYTLTSLPDGQYVLEEVRVPDGYISTVGKIVFKIENGKVTVISDNGSNVIFEEATPGRPPFIPSTLDTFTVINEPGGELPSTGGSGTNLIYLIGTILALVSNAGLVMIRSRHRSVV